MKNSIGTVGLFRAVARGDLTPEQAGDAYIAMSESAAVEPRPRFVPAVVWSIFILLVGAILLPADRRV